MINPTVFTSSGTWVCPDEVNQIQIECWGGGSGSTVGQFNGGGGGAYSRKNLYVVVPGTSYTIVVGTDSVFKLVSTVVCLAKDAVTVGGGGTGGQAASGTGDVKFSGGNGGNGVQFAGSGAGSSAGPAGGGNAGTAGINTGSDPRTPGPGGVGVNTTYGTGSGGGGQTYLGVQAGPNSSMNGSFPGGGAGGRGDASSGGVPAGGQVVLTPIIITTSITTDTSEGFPVNGNEQLVIDSTTTQIGFVADTATHTNPGNVAPGSSAYTLSTTQTVSSPGAGNYVTKIFNFLNGGPILIDFYDSNINTTQQLGNGAAKYIGQSFTTTSSIVLDSCSFYLSSVGTPSGNVTAQVFAHTGTYGTSSKPTGAVLATSNVINANTISGTYSLITFNFSAGNRITLSATTHYCILVSFSNGDGSNYLLVYYTFPTGTASGNKFYSTDGSSWTLNATQDTAFNVYGVQTYYVRAYCNNSGGYSYGAEITYTPNYKISFMGTD
jgi:hypothetical protein